MCFFNSQPSVFHRAIALGESLRRHLGIFLQIFLEQCIIIFAQLHGSTFTAVIPLEIAAKASGPKAPAPRNEQYLAGRHILVAEDQAINYEVIEYLLQAAGAVVERAENGQEALQRFCTAAPGSIDLILMPLTMVLPSGRIWISILLGR